MAKPLTTATHFATQQMDSDAPFIWFYELEVPSTPQTRYRIVNYTRNITLGVNSLGQDLTYYKASVGHSPIEEVASGDLPEITVTVGDSQRDLISNVRTYGGFDGQPAVIGLIHSDELNNPNAAIRAEGEVISSRVKQTNDGTIAEFKIAAYNLYKLRFPNRRYTSKHCVVNKFGDAECGYDISTGSFTTCNRTEAQCTERGLDEVASGLPNNHPKRMKFFPGIPRGVSFG